jgi:dipeptidyl aminopeptidase/acylaminoacyl peptidase
MDLESLAKLIRTVVSIPRYSLVGITKSSYLVYGSTLEGVYKLYAIDLNTGREFKVSEEPVHLEASTSRKSDVVVYTRDVSRGFELVKIYGTDLRTLETYDLSEGVQPQRVVGLGYDGARVAWSGSVGTEASIYLSDTYSRRAEPIAKARGREYVTDVNERYVVGYGHLRDDPFSVELFAIDLRTLEMRVITPREGSVNRSPKLLGSKVLFESNYENLDTFKLYVYDLESGTLESARLTYSDMATYNPVEYVDFGWIEGGGVWAIGKRMGRSRLFVDGSEVKTPEGMVLSAEVYGNHAYVTHTSLRDPPRVLRVDIRSGTYSIVVGSKVPKEVVDSLAEVTYVEVPSFDGVGVPTYVLVSSRNSKPGPLVVYPHGGPWAEVADSWSPILLLLTSLGYHVVAPNFRGSTGYGERFRKLDLGDPGGGDLEDVVYATRWAINNGIADPGRVAIVGYSYGGYMTFMAMVKYPELWRCGVAGAGVTDWVEDYELADAYFKKYDEILFAGRKELFIERSPITYVHNLRSPICIVHPQNDSRCPLRPIMKFAYKLMELGKPFELHVIPDIGHAISLDAEALSRYLLYATMFLRKHLT